ncbi:MAG: alpha-amylase family glycosyl hydrolase, partial [Chloroflexota bacterium]
NGGFSIDSWRLDVANMTGNLGTNQLDHEVWRELRQAVRDTNSEAYILGEYFQDGTAHLQGDELDASMNYQGFNIPMRRWLVPEKKQVINTENPYHYKPSIPAEVMAEQWQNFMSAVPYPIALQQFNQLDSHDVSRILSVVYDDVELVKLGTALMMAFPGVPCLYYGTEIGMAGEKEPLNRRCMRWDETTWNHDLLDYTKQIIAIRKASHALKHGGFKVLVAEGDLIVFARQSTEQTVIVVGYRGDETLENVSLSASQIGLVDDTQLTDLISDETLKIAGGQVNIPTLEHGQTLFLAVSQA